MHFSGILMGDTDIYSSSMSHLSQAFPKQRWSCFVRRQKLSSPLHFSCDAVSCSLGFVLRVLAVIEAQYLFATSFIFSELFRNWNRSSNSSNFSDFPSKVGIVVVRDLGSFEILLLVFLTLAETLFVANCWRANKTWSASNVAGVFSQRNFGWLVERAFFCLPEEIPEEQ